MQSFYDTLLYLIKTFATTRLISLSLTKLIKIKQVALCPGNQSLVNLKQVHLMEVVLVNSMHIILVLCH